MQGAKLTGNSIDAPSLAAAQSPVDFCASSPQSISLPARYDFAAVNFLRIFR